MGRGREFNKNVEWETKKITTFRLAFFYPEMIKNALDENKKMGLVDITTRDYGIVAGFMTKCVFMIISALYIYFVFG